MRVHGVTDGPLFPDTGSAAARVKRRVRSIGLETLLFVVITVASPLLVVAAALVDAARFVTGQRQFMSLRLLAMAWWFLLGEMRAYPTAAAIAVFSRYGSERRRRWAYALRIRWMAGHVAGLRVIMGLDVQGRGRRGGGARAGGHLHAPRQHHRQHPARRPGGPRTRHGAALRDQARAAGARGDRHRGALDPHLPRPRATRRTPRPTWPPCASSPRTSAPARARGS